MEGRALFAQQLFLPFRASLTSRAQRLFLFFEILYIWAILREFRQGARSAHPNACSKRVLYMHIWKISKDDATKFLIMQWVLKICSFSTKVLVIDIWIHESNSRIGARKPWKFSEVGWNEIEFGQASCWETDTAGTRRQRDNFSNRVWYTVSSRCVNTSTNKFQKPRTNSNVQGTYQRSLNDFNDF